MDVTEVSWPAHPIQSSGQTDIPVAEEPNRQKMKFR